MTDLDAALGGALIALIAWRLGWNAGAHRMAAALRGRKTGITTWPARIFEARSQRRRQKQLERDESLLRFVRAGSPDVDAEPMPESPAAQLGQYL